MDGNLCRCMTYARIQRAIMREVADCGSVSLTKHQKFDVLPNLDRRSFLVGTAAIRLVFGYVGAPAIKNAWRLPPPISSRPSGTRSATTAR